MNRVVQRASNRLLTVLALAALLLAGLVAFTRPAAAQDTGAAITIYNAACTEDDIAAGGFAQCRTTPGVGNAFQVGVPNSDAFSEFAVTDDAGFVTFSLEGLATTGFLRVIQQLPANSVDFAVGCTVDGVEIPVTIIDSGNPALAVVDLEVAAETSVACDWFTVLAGKGTDLTPTVEPTTVEDDATATAVADGTTAPTTTLPDTGVGAKGTSAGFGSMAALAGLLAAACGVGLFAARRRFTT